MPTFDIYLPPRTFASWHPKAMPETVHPVVAAWRLIAGWIERSRQRRMLATLDDHMLRDIGITRADAARECEKPFWLSRFVMAGLVPAIHGFYSKK